MPLVNASVIEQANNAAANAEKTTSSAASAFSDLGAQMSALSTTSNTLLGVWDSIIKSSPELKKQADSIRGSFGKMAKSIGTALVPTFRKFAEVMKGVANWFTGLSSNVRWAIGLVLGLVTGVVILSQVVLTLAATVGGIVSAFATLSAVGSALAGGLSTVSASAGLASASMTGLMTSMLPIIAVALALIAIVGVLYLAWKNNLGGIRTKAKQVFKAIRATIQRFVAFVKPFIDKFLSAVFEGRWGDALNTVLAFSKTVFRKLLTAYVKFSLALYSEVAKLGARIVTEFERTWSSAVNATKRGINGIVAFFEEGINAILEGINRLTGQVERFINDIIREFNKLPEFNFEQVEFGEVGEVSLSKPLETKSQSTINQQARKRLQNRLAAIERGEQQLSSRLKSEINGLLRPGKKSGRGSGNGSPPSPSSASSGGGQTNNVNIERMEVNSQAPAPSSRRDSNRLAEDISARFADKMGRR